MIICSYLEIDPKNFVTFLLEATDEQFHNLITDLLSGDIQENIDMTFAPLIPGHPWKSCSFTVRSAEAKAYLTRRLSPYKRIATPAI